MPLAASKQCLVAVDAAGGPLLCQLTLPPEATVDTALRVARTHIDDASFDPPIDWEGGAVGIWGLQCSRSAVPQDGDRVELYRALTADPRQRRRQRARAGRGP